MAPGEDALHTEARNQPVEGHTDDALVTEPHSIEDIPESERHGSPISQGTTWFAAHINFVTVLIGSLAIGFGLGFWVTAITCVTANILGALMNCAAVAMGPNLGMPQMPMGRAAFGYIGDYLPAFFASLLFVGYFTFMATLLYTEPIGKSLNGGEVSYDISAIVAGVTYWVWASRARADEPARSAAPGPVARRIADL